MVAPSVSTKLPSVLPAEAEAEVEEEAAAATAVAVEALVVDTVVAAVAVVGTTILVETVMELVVQEAMEATTIPEATKEAAVVATHLVVVEDTTLDITISNKVVVDGVNSKDAVRVDRLLSELLILRG